MDLIDVNDAAGEFLPPSDEERKAFRDALSAELRMPVVRRYSGGKDIRGACGMLAGKEMLVPSDGDSSSSPVAREEGGTGEKH
jgi:adenine C2-methylase RlmN of 23S rRNA A2503 and tRNA A37